KNTEVIVKAALDAFGRIDILVNNAGILRDVIFHKMTWSDWSDVIDVHLNGSFNMSRAVAPLFRDQGPGAFVHMRRLSGLVRRQRARYGALQCSFELHRAVRLHAHD